jgi:hypothetical protein
MSAQSFPVSTKVFNISPRGSSNILLFFAVGSKKIRHIRLTDRRPGRAEATPGRIRAMGSSRHWLRLGLFSSESAAGCIFISPEYTWLCTHQFRRKLALFFQITFPHWRRASFRDESLFGGLSFPKFSHDLAAFKLL